MSQCLLVANTGTLDDLSEGVEDLAGHTDSLEEVDLSRRINHLLPGVVPVEVHHGLLKPKQVVDSAYDQIYGGRIACLGPQIILPICS